LVPNQGAVHIESRPFVTAVMTDGCVHLLYNSSWKFHQLAAGQLLSGQPVRYGKGSRYGPSITNKITPAGSLSPSQPGGPPCWASSLTFGLIGPYSLHCNKTDREIPVHTHDDAGRQRFCTGKYFPYESGINTCLAPEVFHTSGIFP
jgi:hypothetical protein